MNKLIKISLIFFLISLIFFWFLDYDFKKKQFTFKNIKFFLSKQTITSLKDIYTNFFDVYFIKTEENTFLLNNQKITYEKYSNKLIKNRYYLEQNSKNIFFITPLGNLFYLQKKNFLIKNKLIKLKSNIKKIIGENYLKKERYIIKELLIVDDEIFISYLFNKSGCYSNSILRGKLSLDFIEFSNFLTIEECERRFNWAVGGNLKKYKKNQILLSTGDYNGYEDPSSYIEYDDPQNKESFYGKILSIDLITKKIDLISMGHRNPQGLFYDEIEDIIFSTEHGPQGGDEININNNPSPNDIKNFGWPISSYGEHYGAEEGLSNIYEKNPKLANGPYKKAPLYKSHRKYGFEEPFKYFTPSIGITEILKVKNRNEKNSKLLIASMGDYEDEGDMSLHIVEIDENLKEMNYNRIYIGERIRDIIDLGNGSILMSLESTGSFGVIKNIY